MSYFHSLLICLSVCTNVLFSSKSDAEPAWRTQATKMTSSEAFVETMVSHGTSHVFGIVGSAFMDALDIFEPAGIRFLPVQHEQNAVHMADGFSRVTNSPGVCIAQNGPGITNFVTGVAAAYWAHSPVVVITPETGSLTNGLGGFQETNQVSNEGANHAFSSLLSTHTTLGQKCNFCPKIGLLINTSKISNLNFRAKKISEN